MSAVFGNAFSLYSCKMKIVWRHWAHQ